MRLKGSPTGTLTASLKTGGRVIKGLVFNGAGLGGARLGGVVAPAVVPGVLRFPLSRCVALVGIVGGFAGASMATAANAQVVAPGMGGRIEVPAGAVFDDSQRVFGDDADVFAPLAIVGALGVSVGGSFDTTYSDNVARQQDGGNLSPRFRSKGDWTFKPTVRASAERGIGQHRLFASGSIGRTIYARNTQLNSNRFGFGGGADLRLGRSCSANLGAAWSRRDTQLGSFEEVIASQQQRTNFRAGAACATVTGISGSLNYSRGGVKNFTDDPNVDRSFANVRSQSVNGGLGYQVGSRGQVGLNAGWSENIYPNQIVNGVENQNEVKSLSAFASYRVGSSLRANGSIGYTKLTSNVIGATDFSGTTWGLGVTYFGPRVGANINMGQGVNGGAGSSANYSVRKYLGASGTYRLNDRMSASAGYNYSNASYRGVSQIPETIVARETTDNRFFVGGDYALNRMIRLGLDFNHQRRSAKPDNYSYKVNSATLSVRARF